MTDRFQVPTNQEEMFAEALMEFCQDNWDKAFISAQQKLQRDPTEEETYSELDLLFEAECERLGAIPEYNGDEDEEV